MFVLWKSISFREEQKHLRRASVVIGVIATVIFLLCVAMVAVTLHFTPVMNKFASKYHFLYLYSQFTKNPLEARLTALCFPFNAISKSNAIYRRKVEAFRHINITGFNDQNLLSIFWKQVIIILKLQGLMGLFRENDNKSFFNALQCFVYSHQK